MARSQEDSHSKEEWWSHGVQIHPAPPEDAVPLSSFEAWKRLFDEDTQVTEGVCAHCGNLGPCIERISCAEDVLGNLKCGCRTSVCAEGCKCTGCGSDISGFHGVLAVQGKNVKAVCGVCSSRYSHVIRMGNVWYGDPPNAWYRKYYNPDHKGFEGEDEM